MGIHILWQNSAGENKSIDITLPKAVLPAYWRLKHVFGGYIPPHATGVPESWKTFDHPTPEPAVSKTDAPSVESVGRLKSEE
ncbi:hypothetical protein HKX48_004827 [Thoreauomyces humboldtii]|nr:hypothetical protein HKX48_004827 [Thoreauomyces humboldtii]